MRRLFRMFVLLGFAFGAWADDLESQSDDLRILQVVLDEEVLSNELNAHVRTNTLLVPLGELTRVLELAITVRPAEGTASGFLAREDRTFRLDVNRRQVTLKGTSAHFAAALVELHPDDIYVESKLLAEWLQVDLNVDLAALRLTARPREPLPLQLRRQRASRRSKATAAIDPGFPRWPNHYGWLSVPAIDQRYLFTALDA